MAKRMGTTVDAVAARVKSCTSRTPAGHRGSAFDHLSQLCVMQTPHHRGRLQRRQDRRKVLPEIMVRSSAPRPSSTIARIIRKTADAIIKDRKSKVKYMVGTMIEIPRAALTADAIAESAEFFSFGTNDLTQMTFGFSRDDIGSFLPDYLNKKILPVDPFLQLDASGVGQLVEMAVKKGRSTRPELKCGICGEHGGDPASVKFCCKAGLNYVSCSPYRVPIARLAAAQAALGK
jgi:pyruvate,orthophosphate dikinase